MEKMDYNDHIYGIIIRSFNGDISAEEAETLERWKSSSRENLEEYHDFEAIWKESGKLAIQRPIQSGPALYKIHRQTGMGRKRWTFWAGQAAAVLLLSILFGGLYNHFTKQPVMEQSVEWAYQEVKASYGTQTRVSLSDGTVVNLNSGSTLKFPVSFADNTHRKVELVGEGFFEVAHNEAQPFVVGTEKLQVEVLGTRFNMDAWPDNENITVALVEGSVEIQQVTGSGITTLTQMEPGQVAALHLAENKLKVSHQANLEKYYAWTEGKIVFVDDPIQVVVEKLSNWYNVDIVIADNKLQSYRFTGTFIEEPVDQVLSLLSMTSPMQFMIEPSQKQNDNSYSRRRIILKSR